MASFVPIVHQLIWFKGQVTKAAEVLAVDQQTNMMGIRPLGSSPIWVEITDNWSAIPPNPTFPDLWCVVTATDVSKGFASRQAVINNAPPGSIALLHVNPDNSIDVEYPFL